jgi:hypothetical protein
VRTAVTINHDTPPFFRNEKSHRFLEFRRRKQLFQQEFSLHLMMGRYIKCHTLTHSLTHSYHPTSPLTGSYLISNACTWLTSSMIWIWQIHFGRRSQITPKIK